MRKSAKTLLLPIVVLIAALAIASCGGNTTTPTSQGKPIDPSGNWALKFSDANNNSFIMSALFSQTGSVVTAVNVIAAGNPLPFACVPFSASFANGQVLDVDQFTGDIITPFGNIHFSSTLNPAGSHASGTYTLTGNCWSVASTGTFTADEVPVLAGAWSGTIACTLNCPTGATTGTIAATLTQNDATGIVAGTYAVSGLPDISSGNVSTGPFDVLSGLNWQATFTDANGNLYTIAGGPFNTDPGLGLDRSFNGRLFEDKNHDPNNNLNPPIYRVVMSH
jgi:predicted small secreted protein